MFTEYFGEIMMTAGFLLVALAVLVSLGKNETTDKDAQD
jgi:uncharacterized membrane protein